ncbi:MAG: N-acetylglutaminylglutamine amidotransferase [Thiohalomonadaceae bacterium]
MCGICGELRLDEQAPDLAALGRMLHRLERRGPDHEGSYTDGPMAMGHRRLAVIDLSTRSHQPMLDNDHGLALVFNGSIYNYRELRDELRAQGQHFFSDGDSEVIIKAYAVWGEQCVEHLHGTFAFAIWDGRNQCLFLARDRLGIKPLYYSHIGKGFRFASNTQALLAAGGVNNSIDPISLHHQLSLHGVVPAPRTLLNGIRKLAPGHTLSIDKYGRSHERAYWQLYAHRSTEPRSEQEWTEAIHEALGKAVKRRLEVADVPVGVLLSGGLDSSLLVGLLAEQGVKDILTFSIGFEDVPEEKGSEFEYSDQVVARYATRHHKYTIANDQVLQRLPDAVEQMAEPMVGQDAVAFYLLAERVAQEVKVVQSGQGADEVFAGYFWYPRMEAERGTNLERFAKHYFDRPHSEFLQAVAEPFRGEDHTGMLIEKLLTEPGAETFLDRVLRLDTTTLIVDDPVKRVDNMTMAWGLEARVPFLDHELVELAMQLPPELKLGSGGKHVLKKIARGLVPDSVIDRPKGYFPMPALKYVRGPFFNFMHDILDSTACHQRGLFDRAYVKKLLAEPEQHFTYLRGSKLWHLALLELWLQRNVDLYY